MAGPQATPQEEAASWIAWEREQPGPAGINFAAVAIMLGVGVAILAFVAGLDRENATVGEFSDTYQGILGWAVHVFGLAAVRTAAAIAAGATVVAVAFAGRRLIHHDGAGLLAGLLLGLDPALLMEGQLAVAGGFVRFCVAASLALVLGGHRAWHWLAAVPLAVGVALHPGFWIWCIGLGALLLLRGHIFVAPKHLGVAGLQMLAIPLGVGLLARQLTAAPAAGCVDRGFDAILLQNLVSYGGRAVAVPNMITWYGGLLALAAIAGYGIWQAASSFRATRAAGRVQIRLQQPISRAAGRSGWILILAATAPVVGWPIFGAMALGLAVRQMMRDSLGFGLAIGVATIGFSLLFLIRFLPIVLGQATTAEASALFDDIPWTSNRVCAAP